MKGILTGFCICSVLCLCGTAVPAAEGGRTPTQQERDFYVSSIVPALTVIRIALPPAPEGWVREGETVIDRESSPMPADDIANFHFTYSVTYRRTKGVVEEERKLEEAAAEITKRNTDSAEARVLELNKKKTEINKAIKKARERKETGRERKLKKELEEIKKSIDTVPQERDRKIAEETGPLLVRDRMIEVQVTVNESAAEYPDLKSFTRPKAAFALRRDGERQGATGWKEGRTVILYGDWQEVKNNSFRLRMEQRPFSSRAQSIRIAIAGDRARTEQFLKKTDIRSILDLMK
jgi:hypothetical protein